MSRPLQSVHLPLRAHEESWRIGTYDECVHKEVCSALQAAVTQACTQLQGALTVHRPTQRHTCTDIRSTSHCDNNQNEEFSNASELLHQELIIYLSSFLLHLILYYISNQIKYLIIVYNKRRHTYTHKTRKMSNTVTNDQYSYKVVKS